jgi:hypothetical protein
MALGLEQFAASGSAVAAGLYIPVADLPGVTASELDGTPTGAEKAMFAILNAVYNTLSPSNFDKLGFSVAKPNPTGVAPDTINQNYTLTNQMMVDLSTLSVDQVPVPVAGANSGVGDIPLTAVFAGAASVAAAGAVAGAGIVIPNTEVSAYAGSAAATALAGDGRQYLASLMAYLVGKSNVRDASIASAVISKSRSAATGFTPPANWTQAVDPITGIASADLPTLAFFSITYSVTIQMVLNQATQTFDVNVVTS